MLNEKIMERSDIEWLYASCGTLAVEPAGVIAPKIEGRGARHGSHEGIDHYL
jgi:hypothetical protein